MLDLDTEEVHTLIEDGRDPSYHPASGLLLFARRTTLYAAPLELATLTLREAPRAVLENVSLHVNGGKHAYSLSNPGDLVAGVTRVRPSQLVFVDRGGNFEVVVEDGSWLSRPRMSPDGRRIIAARDRNVLDAQLWMYYLDRKTWEQVTFEGGLQALFVNDGRSIVFSSLRGLDTWNLFRKELDSPTPPIALTPGDRFRFANDLDPSGSKVIYREYGENYGRDLGVLDLETGVHQPLITSPFSITGGKLSPDGRLLAYVSDESGSEAVYVDWYGDLAGGRRALVSVSGGADPLWSRDGTELFFRGQGAAWAAQVSTSNGRLVVGVPQRLFEDHAYDDFAETWDLTADGRFLMTRFLGNPQLAETKLFANWAPRVAASFE